MTLTRRAFSRGGAAVAASVLLPARSRAADLVLVRRSVADLTREKSPLLDSYRRAVEVMMQRDVTDKTSWWFQANIYGAAEAAITGPVRPLAKYWRQSERQRKTSFFLSWSRTYLYFFERIARRACGDPMFALPYWGYDDPQQSALPAAFRPTDNEIGTPPSARRNPLARARRHPAVERGALGLADIAGEIKAALALHRFASEEPLEARGTFGGVRGVEPRPGPGAAAEIAGRVHSTIGLDGDLGSPATAARDPLFWLHQANIDRLWVKWTDPDRGRIPPVDDDGWMKREFTFVDENGDERSLTGAEIVDCQHQLGYRYDDDPPRERRLAFSPPPGGTIAARPEPIVLARGNGAELLARESHLVLKPVPRPRVSPQRKGATKDAPKASRALPTYLVFKDIAARDRTPPYEVSLILEGTNVFEGKSTTEWVGVLDLFGGAGNGRTGGERDPETIAFEVTEAMARLSKMRGYNIQSLRVAIVRRAFIETSGKEFVPPDPVPPIFDSIEIVQA